VSPDSEKRCQKCAKDHIRSMQNPGGPDAVQGGASSATPRKSGLCSVPVNLEYIWLLVRNMQKHLGLMGLVTGAGSLLRVSRIFSTPCYL